MPSFVAVSPIDLPSTEIAETTARWPGAQRFKRAPDLALARSLFRLGSGRVEGFVQHDLQAAADLAEGVDQLEPRDGVEPWLDRQIALPGVAFQVDGKKRFLHDVLWIDTALPGSAPRKAANKARPPGEEIPHRLFRRPARAAFSSRASSASSLPPTRVHSFFAASGGLVTPGQSRPEYPPRARKMSITKR